MSLSGLKKQINKANQYMSEKIGGAERTKMGDEFIAMGRKIDATETAVDEVMAKTAEFLQPNPAARMKLQMRGKGSRYPQVETSFGETMVKGGTELGEDSSFGCALVDCGEAMKELGDVKDDLDVNVRTNFLDPLSHLKAKDLKEVNYHRAKVNSRRLDFDFKKKKLAKGSNVPEEEVKMAEEKFEESLRLAEDGMAHVLENDVEQVAQLDAFVDALMEYHRRSVDILEQLKDSLSERKMQAENRPRMERKPLRSSNNSYNSDVNGGMKNTDNIDAMSSAPPPAAPPSDTQKCCRALYDFEPENDGELGFSEGDIITLTSEIDENWLDGQIDGRSGFFPRNYVEIINF